MFVIYMVIHRKAAPTYNELPVMQISVSFTASTCKHVRAVFKMNKFQQTLWGSD